MESTNKQKLFNKFFKELEKYEITSIHKRKILLCLIAYTPYEKEENTIKYTIKHLSALLRLRKSTIHEHLQDLLKTKMVKKVGSGKSVAYLPNFDYLTKLFFERHITIVGFIKKRIEMDKQKYRGEYLPNIYPKECLEPFSPLRLQDFPNKQSFWEFLRQPLLAWKISLIGSRTYFPYFYDAPFLYIHLLNSLNLKSELSKFFTSLKLKKLIIKKIIQLSAIHTFFMAPFNLGSPFIPWKEINM